MTLDRYGMHPALRELPDPQPGPREVLVRVRATSVNPVDWKQASGAVRLVLGARFPGFVPGYDVAGVVEALGPGVTGFTGLAGPAAKGQPVHARLSGRAGGANAELARVSLDDLCAMPTDMDFASAAGLPLAGMTALQGLRDACRVPLANATQRVLIVGASGGVGHLAVQLARASGAAVVGVCSGRNAALVRRLGAQEVIDYARPDPYQGVAPFDAILDCVGSAPGAFLPLLTGKGRFASCVPGPAVLAAAALNLVRARKVLPVLLAPNAADLAVLDGLYMQGKLKVVIDSRYPFEQLPAAWARSASARAVGKIIIEL